MDKVIFLDVDGVLNTDSTKILTKKGFIFVDDKHLEVLKRVIDETGAKIVLSSTWRRGWRMLELGMSEDSLVSDYLELKEKLLEFGIEIYDKTIIKDKYMRYRGEEIQEYVERKGVKHFVILDDLSGEYLRPVSGHHLQTSMRKGLEEKHIKKIKKILEM